MTTNIIDTAIHGSSFPSSYTGAGTIAASAKNAGGIINQSAGFFTSNGNATQINLGFRPLRVKVVNLTDGIVWEWQYGFGATQSIKTTLGGSFASVLDTGTAFTVSTDLAGNHTLLLSETLNGTSKVLSYMVEG